MFAWQANALVAEGMEHVRRYNAALQERDERWAAEAEREAKIAEEARLKVCDSHHLRISEPGVVLSGFGLGLELAQ